MELGFSSTVGIIHDGDGHLKPLGERRARGLRRDEAASRSRSFSRFNYFQEAIAKGKPNDWRCRAGARYLYICEDGLVHYCSQQRGYPGAPLEQYTKADIEREYNTEKWCAPLCTVACVHQVAILDNWRDPQKGESDAEVAPQRLRDAIVRTLRAG